MPTLPPIEIIRQNVNSALQEDVGDGDITAELIPQSKAVAARLLSKDVGILCGAEWAAEVFRQLSPDIAIEWAFTDGDSLDKGDIVATLTGPARPIMTGERSALNFLQTLSSTATLTRKLVDSVNHTSVTLLDTRKTLPGLRFAQKYAVTVGGGSNHRMGLFDAFLIKENHIAACGGIAAAITTAKQLHGDKPIEVEVQNLDELQQALDAGADIVMLDNFQLPEIERAVTQSRGHCKLEASGGIEGDRLVKIAETGVDYISIGALTKHCKAFDFSLLID